jgi:hypothetical protein
MSSLLVAQFPSRKQTRFSAWLVFNGKVTLQKHKIRNKIEDRFKTEVLQHDLLELIQLSSHAAPKWRQIDEA